MKFILAFAAAFLFVAAQLNAQSVISAELEQSPADISVSLNAESTGCVYLLYYSGTLTSPAEAEDVIYINSQPVYFTRSTNSSSKVMTVSVSHATGLSGSGVLETLTFSGGGSGITDVIEW